VLGCALRLATSGRQPQGGGGATGRSTACSSLAVAGHMTYEVSSGDLMHPTGSTCSSDRDSGYWRGAGGGGGGSWSYSRQPQFHSAVSLVAVLLIDIVDGAGAPRCHATSRNVISNPGLECSCQGGRAQHGNHSDTCECASLFTSDSDNASSKRHGVVLWNNHATLLVHQHVSRWPGPLCADVRDDEPDGPHDEPDVPRSLHGHASTGTAPCSQLKWCTGTK